MDGWDSLVLTDSTLFGIEIKSHGYSSRGSGGVLTWHLRPGQSTVTLRDNLVLAQQQCRHTCDESYAIELYPGPTYRVTGNRVHGAYVGITIDAPCDGFEEYAYSCHSHASTNCHSHSRLTLTQVRRQRRVR